MQEGRWYDGHDTLVVLCITSGMFISSKLSVRCQGIDTSSSVTTAANRFACPLCLSTLSPRTTCRLALKVRLFSILRVGGSEGSGHYQWPRGPSNVPSLPAPIVGFTSHMRHDFTACRNPNPSIANPVADHMKCEKQFRGRDTDASFRCRPSFSNQMWQSSQ